MSLLTRDDIHLARDTWGSKSKKVVKKLCEHVAMKDRASVFFEIFRRSEEEPFPEDLARFIVDLLVRELDTNEIILTDEELATMTEYDRNREAPYRDYLNTLPVSERKLRWAVESSETMCVGYFGAWW